MTRRVPILPTLVVAAAVAAMIALGVWQLRRAEWKADLIARYTAAQAMSADVPWPRDEAGLEQVLFRWSQFDCARVLGIRTTAATSAAGESGVAQVAHCELGGGGEAEVALGWSRRPSRSPGTAAGSAGSSPPAARSAARSTPRRPRRASSRSRRRTRATCPTTTSPTPASGSSSR